MHARIITRQGSPERLEDARSHFRERVRPEMRQLAGYKGAYLLGDRQRGKIVGVAPWESEATARAGAAVLADKLRLGAECLGMQGQPTSEVLEVLESDER